MIQWLRVLSVLAVNLSLFLNIHPVIQNYPSFQFQVIQYLLISTGTRHPNGAQIYKCTCRPHTHTHKNKTKQKETGTHINTQLQVFKIRVRVNPELFWPSSLDCLIKSSRISIVSNELQVGGHCIETVFAGNGNIFIHINSQQVVCTISLLDQAS